MLILVLENCPITELKVLKYGAKTIKQLAP